MVCNDQVSRAKREVFHIGVSLVPWLVAIDNRIVLCNSLRLGYLAIFHSIILLRVAVSFLTNFCQLKYLDLCGEYIVIFYVMI